MLYYNTLFKVYLGEKEAIPESLLTVKDRIQLKSYPIIPLEGMNYQKQQQRQNIVIRNILREHSRSKTKENSTTPETSNSIRERLEFKSKVWWKAPLKYLSGWHLCVYVCSKRCQQIGLNIFKVNSNGITSALDILVNHKLLRNHTKPLSLQGISNLYSNFKRLHWHDSQENRNTNIDFFQRFIWCHSTHKVTVIFGHMFTR